MPVKIILKTGEQLEGHTATRYVLTQESQIEHQLAQITTWEEQGTTGTYAQGCKMWLTSHGEYAILDAKSIHFD